MNCSTIKTPDMGHICKHDLKIDQSEWSTLWQVGQINLTCLLKRISVNLKGITIMCVLIHYNGKSWTIVYLRV